jgi:predicted DNA-binding protein
LVKINHPTRNYTTIYIGLTPKQAQKLRNLAKKEKKTESAALRIVLDAYFKDIDKKGLSCEPYRKFSPIGLKVLPRTIRKDQDARLRKLMEKTGRKISELAREAVEVFIIK